MSNATAADRIIDRLPAYFDDILDVFEPGEVAEAMRELEALVAQRVVEQYRSYFVPGTAPRVVVPESPPDVPEQAPPRAELPKAAKPKPSRAKKVPTSDPKAEPAIPPGTDYQVRNEGSFFLVCPLNGAAADHLRERVQDDATWYGSNLVVEHRYVEDLVRRLVGEGFVVDQR